MIGGILATLLMLTVPAVAMAEDWTCPVCGQTWQFDSRDSAYRSSFAQQHLATHNDSGDDGDDTSNPESNIWYRRDRGIEECDAGIECYNRGEYELAEQHFRKSIWWSRLPMGGNRLRYRWLGKCLEARGLDDQALKAYNTALAITPWDSESHRRRDGILSRRENLAGEEFAGQGDWRKALAKFRRAVGLDPDNASAKANMQRADAEVRHADAADEVRRLAESAAARIETHSPSSTVSLKLPVITRASDITKKQANPDSRLSFAAFGFAELGLVSSDAFRPLNPLNSAQMTRLEKLVALKAETLQSLPQKAAFALIFDKYNAMLNQAAMAASDRFAADVLQIQQAAATQPADVPFAEVKDPKVRQAITAAAVAAAKWEQKQVEDAGAAANADVLIYLAEREEHERRQKIYELGARLQTQKIQALADAREAANRELRQALEQLQRQGYRIDMNNPLGGAVDNLELFEKIDAEYMRVNDRLANLTRSICEYYLKNSLEMIQRMDEEGK
jgi:hypothetical protein